jgi:hypothetical protein
MWFVGHSSSLQVGTVFFLKLIRVLAAVLSIWLIWHLLYSFGRRAVASRQGMQNATDKTHRKFVKSSVVEEESETDDGEES